MSDTQAGSPATKLQEQATAKGDINYSYWASTDKPANSEIAPKKLSPEEAAKLQQGSEQQSSQLSASTWNSAGTFEERAVTDWAKQQVEQMLMGTSNGKATITKCKVVKGDAHIWFIRGKKRHGFEFELDLTWHLGSSSDGAAAEPGSSGTIKLPSASPDELDDLHMEVQLDKASGDAAADAAAVRAAKGLKEPLEAALTNFYAELKQK